MNWPQTLCELARGDEPFVIVTVAGTRGSTPRETGAKMFITAKRTIGTIGGGQLEHECTAVSCQWLREQTAAQTFARSFTLGADCGQCCGGVAEILFEQVLPLQTGWLHELESIVEKNEPAVMITAGDSRTGVTKRFVTAKTDTAGDAVAESAVNLLATNAPAGRERVTLRGNLKMPALFEPLRPSRFEIVLFGAGHVGSALVASMAPLSCQITWVDSRPGVFPAQLPGNVSAITVAEPHGVVQSLAHGQYFLVMTHSHALDLAIVEKILAGGDFAYCGLIGSRSKRRQFEKRLRALGVPDRRLERLTCPIGVDGISGKKPAEIAIATTAQLLQLREAQMADARSAPASVGQRQFNP